MRTLAGQKKTRFTLFKNVSPFYETRPLCAVAMALGVGVFLGANSLFFWWYMGAMLLSLVFIWLKKPYLAAFGCAFFLGLALASFVANPVLPLEGQYAVSGLVKGDVAFNIETGQVKCTLESVTLEGEPQRKNGYWSFYVDGGEELPLFRDGDRVQFQGRLYYPQDQRNPYGFDFEKYLHQNGMGYGLYGNEGLTIAPNKGTGVFHWAYAIRETLTQRLNEAMGEKSALAVAMVLGDRSLMDEEDSKAFSDLGIAHILAISGLHIGFLIGMLEFVFQLLWVKRRAYLPITALFLCLYGLLTGLGDSIIRAAVLAICLLGARQLKRPYDGLTALAFSFILILLFRPLDIEKAGFVMTYTAVLGIFLLYRPILKRLSFLPKWLRESLAVSFSAQMGIMVPIMVFYRQIQLLSPLINLVVIPYAGFLTVLYFLTMIFPFLGIVAVPATELFMAFVKWTGKLPFLTLQTINPPWYLIGLWFLLLWVLSDYSALKVRTGMLVSGILAVAVGLGCYAFSITPARYILFANGQADGAILEEGNYTMVIDAGDHGGDMVNYLRSRNRKVDCLVLTHLHSDHVMGLQAFIDQQVQVKAVYLPKGYDTFNWDQGCLKLVEALGAPIYTLSKGDSLPYTTVLWPEGEWLPLGAEGNDMSLGLRIELNGTTILTAGDLTDRYDAYAAVDADILKVSHHGSKNGTSDQFLKSVSPTVALITCREDAALPNQGVLDKLSNIPVYRTDRCGAITIWPKGAGFIIETYKEQP